MEQDPKQSLSNFFIYGEMYPSDYADDRTNAINMIYGFVTLRLEPDESSSSWVDSIHQVNESYYLKMCELYSNNLSEKFTKETGFKFSVPGI